MFIIYIYPDNLRAKAKLWLWELKDIMVIGIGFLLSVLALAQGLGVLLLIVTVLYAFLSIRMEGASILDFIRPHQNRGSIQNQHSDIAIQARDILARCTAPGIRSAADKEQLAQAWLDLAVSFAKIPIKYDADILKQQQKQEQSAAMKMEVG